MGTEKVRILDRRDFYRDIPTTIDDAVAWILTKINVEFVIEHVQREERPELSGRVSTGGGDERRCAP